MRKIILTEILNTLNQIKKITAQYIEQILELEQNDYICRMDLDEGIAVNQALKENIFAIIPCIINKIPIFLCGKAGSSKSMAVKIIFANLTGPKSIDPYFKTLKELKLVSL